MLNICVSCHIKLYHFQVDAKALGDVEYVDVMMGSNEVILRCSTPAAAEQLVSNAPWHQVEILKGKLRIIKKLFVALCSYNIKCVGLKINTPTSYYEVLSLNFG